MIRSSIIVTTIFFALGAILGYFFSWFVEDSVDKEVSSRILSFEECAAAGYPIMESYPEQCMTPSGEVFVRIIDEDFSENPLIEEGENFENESMENGEGGNLNKKNNNSGSDDKGLENQNNNGQSEKKEAGEEEAVMCTMEAKLCSDGSYVGRIPPSCAFAPCPGN